MARKITITKKDKSLNKTQIFQLLEDFINDSKTGKRTKKDGQRIKMASINHYHYLKMHLQGFCENSKFELKLYLDNSLTYNQKLTAKRYYIKFYQQFTNYLYIKKGYFDNYVGLLINALKAFFNYLDLDRNISVGSYHKAFYSPKNEIPIVALSVEQLHYIIYDEEFNELIKEKNLETIRDTFIFGCAVALRVSDLLSLNYKNLVVMNGCHYIKVKSQKTNTATSIKLPDFAVDVINKYSKKDSRLLPDMTAQWFNKQLKVMATLIPDNFTLVKVRERRGKQVVLYQNAKRKQHYKLSDHITSHTMRKTAITTMLNLGMPEHIVRKISGHAPNSREFYRYVLMAQNVVDEESDKVFDQVKKFVKKQKEVS
jgi:integrase